MAGTKHKNREWLAYQTESAPCVPSGSWNSATWIEFLSINLDGVKQALLQDPTLERRILAMGKRSRIKGIRNVTWTAGVKLTGTGALTAVDAQVSATALSTILAHCMGGQHRTYSRTILSAADAHTITFDTGDSAGFIPGCMVAFEDATGPTSANAGKLHFRRVVSVNSGTDTIVLSEDLGWTPAAGDIAHGTITLYVDETYLESAVRDGAIRTLSWFAKKTKGDDEHLWQLEGTVASMAIQGLGRGELPSLQLSMQSANFRTGDGDGLSEPTPGAAQGAAQLSMGRDVLFNVGAYGDETLTTTAANQVAFDPGFTRSPVPTTTEDTDRMEGLADYSIAGGDTKMTATLVPYSNTWYDALEANNEHRLTLYQAGPGGAESQSAGKVFAIHVPRAQIAATPNRTDVDQVHGVALEWSARIPDDCTGGSNEELELSPFLIALA